MRPRLALHVLSIEFRKVFAYRVNVWVNIIAASFTQVLIYYFIWKSIFELQKVDTLGSFTFPMLLTYYIFVPFVERIIRGTDWGFMCNEIYDGSFTRYLIYPIHFVGYKFVAYVATSLVSVVQLLLAIFLVLLIVGFPTELNTSAIHILKGITVLSLGVYLHFTITSMIEMVSFWMDNVWSLNVMLRFVVRFLGGSMLPLTLFPEATQNFLQWTPFPYLVFFPIQCFLGRTTTLEWVHATSVMAVWAIIFAFLAKLELRRGTLQYSGVGL